MPLFDSVVLNHVLLSHTMYIAHAYLYGAVPLPRIGFMLGISPAKGVTGFPLVSRHFVAVNGLSRRFN